MHKPAMGCCRLYCQHLRRLRSRRNKEKEYEKKKSIDGYTKLTAIRDRCFRRFALS
jgi:hypothetical protein